MDKFPKLELQESDEEFDEESEYLNPIFFHNKFISYMFSRKIWYPSRQLYIPSANIWIKSLDWCIGGQGRIYASENFKTTICYWIESEFTFLRIINSSWNYNLQFKLVVPTNFSITKENQSSIDIFFDKIEQLLFETISKSTTIPTLNFYECVGEWIMI